MNVRNILNLKLGFPIDYECVGHIGDNYMYNSKDFTLDEVSFLENVDITPEVFKNLYDMYIDNIIQIIERNPYMKVYSIMDKDEMSNFDEEKIKKELVKFMNSSERLNSRNKITIKTFLELLNTYDLQDLINGNAEIKKELENGVFDLIKDNEEGLSKKEREKINRLNWNKEDVDNYFNLRLLFKRFNYLKQNENLNEENLESLICITEHLIKSGVPNPDEITNFEKRDNVLKADFYSGLMKKIYNEYEQLNRQDIVKNLYRVNETSEEIPENMLLHFYGANTENLKTNFINTIINRIRMKNNEEILPTAAERLPDGKMKLPNYPDLEEKYRMQIEDENLDECLNELLPDKTFNITKEDIENNLGYRLDVLKSDQLACTTIKAEQIINDSRIVRYAVGFGKSLNPENIRLSCTKNANSNLGIDSIPYRNKFLELSNTFNEVQASDSERKEILLDRKNLKVDYLLCIYNQREIDKLGEDKELIEKQIQEEIAKAKKLGITVKKLDLQKFLDAPDENTQSKNVPSEDNFQR